jgi:hypothetical protein
LAAGFDGAVLPGRIQAMRMAGDMRKILKTAAEVLQHDRAALTYAVDKLRKTGQRQGRAETSLKPSTLALSGPPGKPLCSPRPATGCAAPMPG